MTLVNSVDQSRVTRIASVTYNNPAKYGAYIAPLQLQNLPQVQKIYNKVATETNISVPSSNPTPRIIVKYSNVFYERNLVNTTMANLVVKGTTITQADGGSDETVYGQGKAYIRISPFDNYYKFTFYKQGAAGNTQLIDLESSGTYYMVFINNSNKKVSAPSIDDKNIANSAKGELAFRVSETLATEILQYTNRTYSITNRPPASNDPNIINDQIPTTGAAKDALASRSTALNESIKDVVLSAQNAGQSLLNGVLTVSANSSSVLYYGNWLKVDETIPSTTTNSLPTGATAQISPIVANLPSSIIDQQIFNVGNNIFSTVTQAGGGTASAVFVTGDSGLVEVTQNNSSAASAGQKLTTTELQSAISLAVESMLAYGMTVQYVINYFLNVQSPGYKLYVGITKKIFTDAVKGIFNDADLTVLNNYGNTNAGQTNGGAASYKNSNATQTGGDNGTSEANRR
jgi:hypothetical protein